MSFVNIAESPSLKQKKESDPQRRARPGRNKVDEKK